jgi:hypothetical protein
MKMIDHSSRSTWGPAPTKTGMPYNFCFIKFSPSQTVEAAEAGQTLFRAPKPGGMGLQPSYEPFLY